MLLILALGATELRRASEASPRIWTAYLAH